MTRVYQYPKCGTCRKAAKFFKDNDIDVEMIHIVESPPDKETLRDLWKRSDLPLKKLFNTSGQSYRGGGFKDKLPTMTDEEKLEALAADGKLIKRPIVDLGDTVLVGFKEADYQAAFGK